MKTANEIRSGFLNFFASKEHTIVPSDSVVPKDDPTVLFTTAGMQQFKRQFMGDIDNFTRAATSQKCIRTDDLDQVGKTAFHQTFFEMLGNFSFGDYFKKEAITWAWEYLTTIVNIPQEKLWVSVYKDDQEAEDIWIKTIGLPAERLVRLGDKSNFWPSNAKENGPNGPCGPCSEIFFDYGKNPTCPKGDKCDPDCDCGRFSEIWNLVFTQYNRKEGGTLEALPSKNIDTGMGLERLTAVLQNAKSNFQTDLFAPILKAIDNESQNSKIKLSDEEKHIIADHLRAAVFSINDGVIPSNKERGSVVKRLITDPTDLILRQGGTPFVHKLIPAVVDAMKEAYPELIKNMNNIVSYVQKTSDDYLKVFKTRIPELEQELSSLKQKEDYDPTAELGRVIFIYRDTFGLTLKTIFDIIESSGFSEEDIQGAEKIFQQFMLKQQERSRASSKMAGDVFTDEHMTLNVPDTEFVGYDRIQCPARILRMFKDGQETATVQEGDCVKTILDISPFYAESGGQIGDIGELSNKSSRIEIKDTQRIGNIIIHSGEVTSGSFSQNESIQAKIDLENRTSIMRNHTATHLLQAALRKILGQHVQQQGSYVSNDRLRFDFTHPQAVSADQIEKIEDFVNLRIMECIKVEKKVMTLEQARSSGALAFFAEKYDNTVRVVSIPPYSSEFCGGTHLNSTGQIGLFKIISESAIAQGIRRIEAKTGTGALGMVKQQEQLLKNLSELVKAPVENLPERIRIQTNKVKRQNKDIEKLRFEAIKNNLTSISAQATECSGTKIIANVFDGAEMNLLRKIIDMIKTKNDSCAVLLGGRYENSACLLVSISDDLVKKGLGANEIIRKIAPLIGGNGGGRAQLAQAGSKDASKLVQALEQGKEYIQNKLSA